MLVAGRHALGRLDERLELGMAGRDGVGVARQLVMAAPGRAELAPGEPGLTTSFGLLRPAERIEHVELERRAREPALLELARHRDEALRRRGDVLPRDRTTPGVCARAPVAEHTACDDETGLALGAQLRKPCELLVIEEPVGNVELRLDVRLRPLGTDRGGVCPRAEEKPDRLREDRLPRSRLPRDRVQAGRERKLSLADEDEVLDPEPTKHESTRVLVNRHGVH